MSSWTYVRGMIRVDPIGESTTEKEFVVHTVLDHLPPVTGSEKTYALERSSRAKYSCEPGGAQNTAIDPGVYHFNYG